MKNAGRDRSTSCIFNPASKGFTLLELLVVIAILAVLAAVVVVVINPAELLSRARDTQRATDLRAITTAINFAIVDRPGILLGVPNRVHISLPDTSLTCVNHPTLPRLPAGWEYRCVSPDNLRRIDGTGWIPINFTLLSTGPPLASLPIDPTNNTTHFYSYVTGGSWAATAMFESTHYLRNVSNRDGGTDPARMEVGTSPYLWARATGLVGYWPFEGNFRDHSGLNNHGTQLGGVTFEEGRQGQAGRFDGVDDHVVRSSAAGDSLNPLTAITIEAWVNPAIAHLGTIVSRNGPYSIRLLANQRVEFGVRAGTVPAWDFVSTLDTIPLNTWSHLALTYNGMRQQLYINGVLSLSDVHINGGDMASTAGTVFMGFGASGLANRFNGLIDEVRIYNRALSAEEVRAIFEATR